MKIISTLLISLVFILSGCLSNVESISTNSKTTTALDKQALLQLFSGSTVYEDNKDFVLVGFYDDDNTMKGNIWGSWLNQIDQGSWMVNEQGLFCNRWLGTWSQGNDYNCYRIIPAESEDQYMMILESEQRIDAADIDARLLTITSGFTNEFE